MSPSFRSSDHPNDDRRPSAASADASVYRVRRTQRAGARTKEYRHTLEAIDERSGEFAASCDVSTAGMGRELAIREGGEPPTAPGRNEDVFGLVLEEAEGDARDGSSRVPSYEREPTFAAESGADGEGLLARLRGPRAWHLRPNARYEPNLWTLHDPEGRRILSFEGSSPARRVNPLGLAALSVHDAEGRELFRLIDPRSGAPDRALGIGPDAWALVDGVRLVASIDALPPRTEDEAARPGVLGRLNALLSRPDRGLVSVGAAHVLPAPAAVCLVLLLDELTEPQGGA